MIDAFLKKLNIKFIYIENIDKDITNHIDMIFHGLEYFDLPLVEAHTLNLLKILEPYKKSLYYRELYLITNIIYKYYIQMEFMSNTEFIYLENIYEILGYEIEEICTDILFKYINIVSSKDQNYNRRISNLKLKNRTSVCNKINYYYSILYQPISYCQNINGILNDIEVLEKKLIHHYNFVRCLDLYEVYIAFLLYFPYEHIELHFALYLEKCYNIVINIKIESKVAQFYMHLGLINMELELFDKAIIDFMKCLEIKTLYQKHVFVLLYFCAQKQNITNSIIWSDILNKIDESILCPQVINKSYEFFVKYSQNHDPKMLEKLLIFDICKLMIKYDKIYIYIFLFELLLLVEKTKKYSDLYKYINKILKAPSLKQRSIKEIYKIL